MRSNVINLAILDDHTLMREALNKYLSQQKNIHVVTQSSSVYSLFTELKTASVDVLLMDVFLPAEDGYEAIRTVRLQYPEIKVIAVSMSTDLKLINDLIDIGIHAYISKSDKLENLLHTILSVSENT